MRTALIALWGLLTFILVQAVVFLPLFALGLVLMPALCTWAPIVRVPSRLWLEKRIEAFRWDWANELFGNHEDGLCPAWWCDVSMVHEPTPLARMTWFLRNPVSNMRFWPLISTTPDPARVHSIGTLDEVPPAMTPGWFIAWQGPFVGALWQCRSWGIWAGWAVNPRDARVVPLDDWRRWGYSVVLQIQRW